MIAKTFRLKSWTRSIRVEVASVPRSAWGVVCRGCPVKSEVEHRLDGPLGKSWAVFWPVPSRWVEWMAKRNWVDSEGLRIGLGGEGGEVRGFLGSKTLKLREVPLEVVEAMKTTLTLPESTYRIEARHFRRGSKQRIEIKVDGSIPVTLEIGRVEGMISHDRSVAEAIRNFEQRIAQERLEEKLDHHPVYRYERRWMIIP